MLIDIFHGFPRRNTSIRPRPLPFKSIIIHLTITRCTILILCHIDSSRGGDHIIGDCTAAVARQRSANNNRGMVISARSAKQRWNKNIVMVFPVRSVL
jgi:hypothetical protein